MLLEQTNVSKIRALWAALMKPQTAGQGRGFPSEVAYATAKDAKAAIKEGYLKALFPNYADEAFTIDKYAHMARVFDSPKKDEVLKVMLGADYKRTKQLMNLFSEASLRPTGNLGTLFLRGQEYERARQAGRSALNLVTSTGGATAFATGGLFTGMGSLAAVLMAPTFMVKASHNQKVVNRLLAFDKRRFTNAQQAEKALTLIIDDVMRGMDEYEKAEFRAEYGLYE